MPRSFTPSNPFSKVTNSLQNKNDDNSINIDDNNEKSSSYSLRKIKNSVKTKVKELPPFIINSQDNDNNIKQIDIIESLDKINLSNDDKSHKTNTISNILHKVAFLGDLNKCIELLSQGHKGDSKDSNNKTIFHYIAEGFTHNSKDIMNTDIIIDKYIQIGSYILKHYSSISINDKDINGNTPLHYTIGNCPPNFVLWLISEGARNLSNNEGMTPFDLVKNKFDRTWKDEILLSRADGIIFLAANNNYLNYRNPPDNFHCSDRFSLRSAYTMALISKLSYLGLGHDNISSNNIIHCFAKRWSFTNSHICEFKSSRGIVFTKNASDNMKKCYVIAFRGTTSKTDILADISALKSKGKHLGIINHLTKISNFILNICIDKTALVYLTGHSLGGGMATLFMDILKENGFPSKNLYLYTFGQPRVGTEEYQQKFDNTYTNAYIIQRYLDPVPHVPTYVGKLVGKYLHCGSLRYIDKNGQLFNDIHYKFEDINRTTSEKRKTLQDIKNMWTEGLKNINNSTIRINNEDTTHSPDILKRTSAIHRVVKDVVKATLDPFESKSDINQHSIDKYVLDMSILELRIGKKFNYKDNPYEAISSQISSVDIPIEFTTPDIKHKIIQRERGIIYNNWIKYYTFNLPKYSYNINTNINILIKWIQNEGLILQQISYIEHDIQENYPNISKSKNYIYPQEYHRKNITPIIETAYYSCLYRIIDLIQIDNKVAIQYLSRFYWCLPLNTLIIQEESLNTYTIIEDSVLNTYKNTIILCLENILKSNNTLNTIINDLINSLKHIQDLKIGNDINYISNSLVNINNSLDSYKSKAKLTLLQVEIKILYEFWNKCKELGIKPGKCVTSSNLIEDKSTTSVSINTTAGIILVSGSGAGPGTIAAGIIFGTVVEDVSSRGSLIGSSGINVDKIPEYFQTIIETYENLLISFINLGNIKLVDKLKKDIIKVINTYPIRGKIFIHIINGLYSIILLSKFKYSNIKHSNTVNKEIENFYNHIIILINHFIAIINIDNNISNKFINILIDLSLSLEDNIDEIIDIITIITKKLDIKDSIEGIYLYKSYIGKQKAIISLKEVLNNKINEINI